MLASAEHLLPAVTLPGDWENFAHKVEKIPWKALKQITLPSVALEN